MGEAAIYCRISDDREGRSLGVARQEQDARAYADSHGYIIGEVYIENDVSASTRSTKRRPLFEEMMSAAETGQYAAIIAYSSSRLTRRPMENERLIALYEKHGVLIHYVNTNDNDLSTARGRRRARDDAARDAEEAEEISERVKRATLQRAESGQPHGGPRPYGWPDRVHLEPAEHAVITDAACRVLAGESVRSVVADLNKRKVPTATGAPWAATTLRRILTAHRTAGIVSLKGEVVTKGTWEPALDEATWRRLRSLLLDPARTTVQTARRNLLVGIALCGECDAAVGSRIVDHRRRYVCKPCGLYRSMIPVDLFVEGYMTGWLEKYAEPEQEDDSPEMRAARVEAARLRDRIEDTKREFTADDTISALELRQMLRDLRARLKVEEGKLATPRERELLAGVTGERSAEVWDGLSLDRRRSIIAATHEVRLLRTPPGKRGFDPASVRIARR